MQGLPFFTPVLKPGARFDVYGPPQDDSGGLGEAFGEFMRPPFFPVTTKDLLGDIRFHDVWDADFELDGAKVCARPVPHVGLTNGYRVEMGGAVVAYISDHQMPVDGSHTRVRRRPRAVRRRRPADPRRPVHRRGVPGEGHWGHCTADYAVHVAREAGVRRLALFHHDPTHHDDAVDAILAGARSLAQGSGIDEVLAAHEGLVISFG